MNSVNVIYQQLIAQTDALAARLSTRYARHLICRAGCSGCCQHHLSIFAVEAEAVREAVDGLPDETRQRLEQQARQTLAAEMRDEPVACPMLLDDRCSIYESRPLICRTQGLPLLFEAEDGAPEVDFCPLNFTDEAATDDLDENHLVPLDALNLSLARVNLQFCRETKIADEKSGERFSMAEIVLYREQASFERSVDQNTKFGQVIPTYGL